MKAKRKYPMGAGSMPLTPAEEMRDERARAGHRAQRIATPRTDAKQTVIDLTHATFRAVHADFARQLETELATANKLLDEAFSHVRNMPLADAISAHLAACTPAGACCWNEARSINGGCTNCGDPCL